MPKIKPLSLSVGVVIPEKRPLGSIGVVNPKDRKVTSLLVNKEMEEKKERLEEKRDITSVVEGMKNLPDYKPVEDLPSNYRRPMGKSVTMSVQEDLRKYDPSIEVDGSWGPKTEDAYRKYYPTIAEEKKVQEFRNLQIRDQLQQEVDRYNQFQNANRQLENFTGARSVLGVPADAPYRGNMLDSFQSPEYYRMAQGILDRPWAHQEELNQLWKAKEEDWNARSRPTAYPGTATMVASPIDYALGAYAMAPAFGAVASVPYLGAAMNLGFMGHGAYNMINPESDMRQAWSKYASPEGTDEDLYTALFETGLNSLNFLGAGAARANVNELKSGLQYGSGFVRGVTPNITNRMTRSFVNPRNMTLNALEEQTIDDVSKLHNLLYEHHHYPGDKARRFTGEDIRPSNITNILNSPQDLEKFKALTSRLHPNVVEKIIGKENFKQFGNLFPYSQEALTGASLPHRVQIALYNKYPKLFKPGELATNASEAFTKGFQKGQSVFNDTPMSNAMLANEVEGVIPTLYAYEGRAETMRKLREGMDKLESAQVGELLAPSTNLSLDSYRLGTNNIVKKIKNGTVKFDSYKMAPLNSQSFSNRTTSTKIIEASLKDLNNGLKEMSKELGVELPKAYWDPRTQAVIAPYVVVEKVAEPTMGWAKVTWREKGVGREYTKLSDKRYVKLDGSSLKPGESMKILDPTYTPKFKNTDTSINPNYEKLVR
jgi:hypothetical protein